MNQIPNIEEVDNTIKIGYDPASPDGDKSRVVLRFPDGQLKAFIPEDEYHQQLQKARDEATKEIIADYMEALGTVQLPQEVWLWIADINGKYLNKTLKDNI